MYKRIAITGATGFLGSHMIETMKAAGSRVGCTPEILPLTHHDLEITDREAVLLKIAALKPDVIIHCAAISSTAYAAEHPDESMSVNVEGPANLASAAAAVGARLVVMSSDQVYGGCPVGGPLPEEPFAAGENQQTLGGNVSAGVAATAKLAPNNIYGAHKLLMESRVLEACPDALVLRLSWMFESFNPEAPHTDIISRLVNSSRTGTPIKASSRELRGMTEVGEVCSNIIKALDVLPGGVYNFGSGNLRNSYETLSLIAREAGIPEQLIAEDTSWGRNLSMDCSKAARFGITFRDTAESVIEVLGKVSIFGAHLAR